MDNKKPIDYYDRIADALEIISGDSSHTEDESPTMDYYDRIADALEEIAEGGGSGLPAVTSDDNGDVLTVVEGAWAKAAPSGSNVVILGQADLEAITYNDFIAYANAGKIIFALVTGTAAETNIPYFSVVSFTVADYDNVGEQYVVRGTGIDVGAVAYTVSLVASTATEAMTTVWD